MAANISSCKNYLIATILYQILLFKLAEVCLAKALTEFGESPVYQHLLALCTRLRRDVDTALCHIQHAVEKFGDVS